MARRRLTRRTRARLGKGRRLSKKKKKQMLVVGAVALGAYLLFFRKPAAAGNGVELGMKDPADVTAGQLVSSTTYREIEGKRPGMQYAQVSSGVIPGELSFTPAVSGKFTRNFSSEGGQLWAEIKA